MQSALQRPDLTVKPGNVTTLRIVTCGLRTHAVHSLPLRATGRQIGPGGTLTSSLLRLPGVAHLSNCPSSDEGRQLHGTGEQEGAWAVERRVRHVNVEG
jgi:hypothetical protein